jgi:hypothetical protein
VNEFVQECRSEWKRLGVPDPVAEEMAAELEADLQEAAAEGVPAEHVLGSSASNPRSFAAAWAGERGVVAPTTPGRRRAARLAAAIGVFALIAAIGGVLVLVASPSGKTRLTVGALSPDGRTVAVTKDDGVQLVDVGTGETRIPAPGPVVVQVSPAPPTIWNSEGTIVRFAPMPRVVAVDVDESRVDTRTIGSVLLAVGLLGVVLSTMLSFRVLPGRASSA